MSKIDLLSLDLSNTDAKAAIASLFLGVRYRDSKEKICKEYTKGFINLLRGVLTTRTQGAYIPKIHITPATTAFLPLPTTEDPQDYEAYISEATRFSPTEHRKIYGRHAEQRMADAYPVDEIDINELRKVSHIYVTRSPCCKCTIKLLEYYKLIPASTGPDIYIPWVYKVQDIESIKKDLPDKEIPMEHKVAVMQINSVMRFLRRGIKVKTLKSEDTKKILEKICAVAKFPNAEGLCQSAHKVVDSNIFKSRDRFTDAVLESISTAVQEELEYEDELELTTDDLIDNGKYAVQRFMNVPTELQEIRRKMLKEIRGLYKEYNKEEVCLSTYLIKKKQKQSNKAGLDL